MSQLKKSKLQYTLIFKSDSDDEYKYEVFQRGDGTCFYALVSKYDTLPHGGQVFVRVEEFNLTSEHYLAEATLDEVEKHFIGNYQKI